MRANPRDIEAKLRTSEKHPITTMTSSSVSATITTTTTATKTTTTTALNPILSEGSLPLNTEGASPEATSLPEKEVDETSQIETQASVKATESPLAGSDPVKLKESPKIIESSEHAAKVETQPPQHPQKPQRNSAKSQYRIHYSNATTLPASSQPVPSSSSLHPSIWSQVDCLHPEDLVPLTRKPLFLVVDSQNSSSFLVCILNLEGCF